jgi:uncharacterized protein YabN with tetrapyrrole methylase and pyrophosphatase domain
MTPLPNNKNGSLVVVGTGITGIGQATLEAVACIQGADVVCYSVTEPTTEYWLKTLNQHARSFSNLYGPDKDRRLTYDEMTQQLVSLVQEGLSVCAVFYGHPGVFVEASHRAISTLRASGYAARMLPGVSADGCLYADLGINPGLVGMQCFEATEFLFSHRRFDPTSGLILWQVGVLGEVTARPALCRRERLKHLADTLAGQYSRDHEVVLYYAATLPGLAPTIQRLRIAELHETDVVPMMTLYVPPLPQRPTDPAILQWFDEP